ncbi:PaaI family thioesterase [Corynebacterium sp. Marseille-P3884]|uniref:PaaI family thioesterase n=1 Tax=Corynebacterium sp. Marseille-P3884 TaxID=2495409 RepID=UPI001B343B66|nr:PaaI family thioesterase [Corynebacterium sp. Marseille-P3884]MBP3947529.1 PaaI family thioesterase [Corynebacterium sp. Marseille-P3884]
MHINDLKHLQNRQLGEEELAMLNSAATEFDSFIGLTFTEFGPEKMVATVKAAPKHHQPAGVVNGGVFCSIGETMGSFAGFVAAGGPVVGMNNSTDLLRSVTDEVIEAEVTPVHVGRRTQLWRTEMRCDGKLVAVSTLRTMVMDA